MESLIIAYDKNMHWIYPDLNSVLSKKLHFLWNGPAVVLSQFRCVHPENFSILTFLWIKTNVAYTRLEVIAKQRSALQVEFITGVKLICYFVLYYCFLHWNHPPNMAVGDLDFYYNLYLWIDQRCREPANQYLHKYVCKCESICFAFISM